MALGGALPGKARQPPSLTVAFGKPLARCLHLNTVDPLLDQHEWQRYQHADPRNSRVHLVGASHFHSGSRERASEEHGGLGGGRRARLEGRGVFEVGEESGREEGGAEGEKVQGDEEDLVHGAEGEEDFLSACQYDCGRLENQLQAYVVGVVLPQEPIPALVDILVATSTAAHAQGRIHVHVVTGQIQRNQELEYNAPPWESLGQEDEQAGGCASVGDHVQYSSKLGALLVFPSCVAI